jgi:hypothetical protein
MINFNLKECQTCKRHFIKLDIHHINGNHKDDKEENKINICRGCHTAIHKNVTCRRNRDYSIQEEEDERTNERIYLLRTKLHKAKYGNLFRIPNDNITKIAKTRKSLDKIYEKIREKFEGVTEIRYS